ncbi:MAG: hypothetical protein KIT26_09945 [Nitrosomonas sp.]|nr:hypothetical protein [Nitrosomonas sp.]
MLFSNDKACPIPAALISMVIFFASQHTAAQSGDIHTHNESPQQQTHATSSLPPRPGIKPDSHMPVRTMQRTGTAIIGARNSISIKSTDAGIIHRPAAPSVPLSPLPQSGSSCINCGIIDFINIAQGNAINAMANGIVAGTIARKIGEHGAHPHTDHTPGRHAHQGQGQGQQHYHVGVTMQDGSRQIIMVPDITGLHRGDFIQLKNGVLTPEYGGY